MAELPRRGGRVEQRAPARGRRSGLEQRHAPGPQPAGRRGQPVLHQPRVRRGRAARRRRTRTRRPRRAGRLPPSSRGRDDHAGQLRSGRRAEDMAGHERPGDGRPLDLSAHRVGRRRHLRRHMRDRSVSQRGGLLQDRVGRGVAARRLRLRCGRRAPPESALEHALLPGLQGGLLVCAHAQPRRLPARRARLQGGLCAARHRARRQRRLGRRARALLRLLRGHLRVHGPLRHDRPRRRHAPLLLGGAPRGVPPRRAPGEPTQPGAVGRGRGGLLLARGALYRRGAVAS
mmetsp:Transcript_2048/g.5088  ORF Transcript_2048/g.5088 Transcript_2048/m.5088 type:complete len:288 (-) Transcript_2048:192-1055(-)